MKSKRKDALALKPTNPSFELTSSKTVVVGLAAHRTEDLLVLKALVEAGEIRPVVDRRFPLERIAEAHAYVGMGQKAGNVIIDVRGGGVDRAEA